METAPLVLMLFASLVIEALRASVWIGLAALAYRFVTKESR